MERVLSQNERIRRAEEIYARRQNQRERTSRATVNIASNEKKNFKLLKRVFLQALISLLLYFIFHLIYTTNYSFSKVTLDKTEELLTYEVDFLSIYNNISNVVVNYISNFNLAPYKKDEIISNDNLIYENSINQDENVVKENIIEENENKILETSTIVYDQNTNIAMENNEERNDEEVETQENTELNKIDAIKQKYRFIRPIERKNFIRIWRKRFFVKYYIYIS